MSTFSDEIIELLNDPEFENILVEAFQMPKDIKITTKKEKLEIQGRGTLGEYLIQYKNNLIQSLNDEEIE
jgi:hypothetical protein